MNKTYVFHYIKKRCKEMDKEEIIKQLKWIRTEENEI
jgi:hypothetical protein